MKITRYLGVCIVMFGMALAGAARAATEHPGSVALLLGLDSVRNELRLTKNQRAALDKIRADFKQDVRLITTRYPSDPVERKAANTTVKKLLTKYNDEAIAVLTPAQHSRLVQIEQKVLGGLVLFLPDRQKQLGLSAEQTAAVEKIKSQGEAFSSRITGAFERGEISLQERLALLRNYRIKQSATALRVLTPAQRKEFENKPG